MIQLSNGYKFDIACASGALAYGLGWWWERYGLIPLGVIDPSQYTIITKTLTFEPRKGNLRWYWPWGCVRLLPGGNTVNAVGLTNPGFAWWKNRGYRDNVVKTGRNTIVSIMPATLVEAIVMGQYLKRQKIKGIEINVSCVNSDHPTGIDEIVKIVETVSKHSQHPVGIKLGATDPYTVITEKLQETIEWVDLINTMPWKSVYPNQQSPLEHLGGGGVSGPDIRLEARKALGDIVRLGIRTPVLSGGGIDCYEEMKLRFDMGAGAVAVGTLILRRPDLATKMITQWRAEHQYNILEHEEKLGWLAFHFRGNRDEEYRRNIALEYAEVVRKLARSGKWELIPTFEDQLPHEYMPS